MTEGQSVQESKRNKNRIGDRRHRTMWDGNKRKNKKNKSKQNRIGRYKLASLLGAR